MKKIVSLLIGSLLTCAGCKQEPKVKVIIKIVTKTVYVDASSDACVPKRKAPFLYYDPIDCAVDEYGENYVGQGGFVTFEHYMWDVGFPDTIIVPFTRNGKFEEYVEACKT